jgi:Flp pilus assembly protein TadD/TolB-like protein
MLAAGTTLGRYRILGLLGSGGMGEVYRARDTGLERDVAVKVILADVDRDPQRVRRFELEARAAGALNDPNLCTIHDVGTHGGSPFVVMELLEGESLRAKLGGGPVPVRRAIDWVAQAAHGLAAAHAKGIVHRDLKPENLFVTRDGRLKVLDFGLAKLTGPDVPAPSGEAPDPGTRTVSGMILGTAGYMAPEQARGGEADPRSDLFALGAILYELVTGERAFRGASFVETLHSILTDEPAPLTAGGREVPPGLESIARRCLAKEPAARFQSASDLAFALEASDVNPAGTIAGTAVRPARRPRARAGAIVLAALVLAVGAGAVFLAWRARTGGTGSDLDSKRIVVAVFENETGDASLAPLGRMTSDWITQGLSRLDGFEVVPSLSVLYAQPAGGQRARNVDPVLALGRDLRAGTVVSGAYYLQGDTLRFQARITDAGAGRLLEALDPVACARNAPLQAIDGLRQRVMGGVAARLGADRVADTGLKPPLYDAYREFITGFESFETDNAAALRHFEKAVTIDPGFSTPLFCEAYIFDEMGDHARAAGILHTLDERRDEATPYGRLVIDMMLAYANHHYAQALQHCRAALFISPRDPMTNLWVGYTAMLSNRPQEAVDTYRRFGPPPYQGHALGTDWLNQYCSALHRLGRFEEALDEAHRARTEHPAQSDLWALEGEALATLGRTAELERLLDGYEMAAPILGAKYHPALCAAMESRTHGRREASLALAERAATFYRRRLVGSPDSTAALTGLLEALRSAEHWAQAADVCRELLRRTPRDADVLGMLGTLVARLGERDEALRIAGALQDLEGPYLFGTNTYRRAGIAAVIGERQGAVDLLRASLAEGRPNSLAIHREIDFESLRDFVPFHKLLEPQG